VVLGSNDVFGSNTRPLGGILMNGNQYKIVSINVAKPKTVLYKGKEVSTGIFKKPVEHPVYLSFLNFGLCTILSVNSV